MSGSADAPIAIDTETELIRDPLHRPRCALAMAFDGKTLVAIHPSRFTEWLWQHRREHLVGHNLAFDWWVLHDLLREQPNRQRLLWDSGSANRLHDTMILDQLLQLATGRYHRIGGSKSGDDVRLVPRNLAAACEQHGVPLVDKESPFRLRFGELLDLSEQQLDEHPEFAAGFAAYALADAVATHDLYRRQRVAALEVMRSVGWSPKPQPRYEIRHDAVERWGPLTEAIQVRASIVLAELSRTPLRVDLAKRQHLEDVARAEYDAAYRTLEATSPLLFKRYKAKRFEGRHRLTKRSLLPQMDQAELKRVLLAEAERLNATAPVSDGKLRGVSTSAKAWAKYSPQSPFIAAWVQLERVAKQLEFLQTLNAPVIYSRYSLLMRSGRTSASAWRGEQTLPGLNIQQLPRGEDVRSLILADEGHQLAVVDYSYIELRTLAAAAKARFGFSQMADTIVKHTLHGGLDPHEVMALAMTKMDEGEWRRLDKDTRKDIRQKAKVCSFGFPGGLGAEKFVAYASASTGGKVKFTKAEAKAAKELWLSTFEEMRLWLADKTEDAIRYQLGPAAAKVWARASWLTRKAATDWLRGAEQTGAMEERGRELIECVCRSAKRHDLTVAAEDGERTPELKKIVKYRGTTTTGRVRADTDYTTTCNGAFQGATADGAKEAMWKLMAAGFKLKIYVHDEVVVELPEKTAAREVKRVEQIMNDAMNDVLGDIPSAVDSHVGPAWAKP